MSTVGILRLTVFFLFIFLSLSLSVSVLQSIFILSHFTTSFINISLRSLFLHKLFCFFFFIAFYWRIVYVTRLYVILFGSGFNSNLSCRMHQWWCEFNCARNYFAVDMLCGGKLCEVMFSVQYSSSIGDGFFFSFPRVNRILEFTLLFNRLEFVGIFPLFFLLLLLFFLLNILFRSFWRMRCEIERKRNEWKQTKQKKTKYGIQDRHKSNRSIFVFTNFWGIQVFHQIEMNKENEMVKERMNWNYIK